MLAAVAVASAVSGVQPESRAVWFTAFLGYQSDERDAQKDILCDTLGALCAVSAFALACARRGVDTAGDALSRRKGIGAIHKKSPMRTSA